MPARRAVADEGGEKRITEGGIYEHEDELFIVEKVYDAQESDGTPIVLVKHRCIDPTPRHTRIERFADGWTPYEPDEEEAFVIAPSRSVSKEAGN